jgi:uncharacterized repeat protein (TIGR01451 family)
MSCTNPNCNPGCGCNGCCPPVPPPVPPTPPICIGEECVEHYDGNCVIYTGPDIPCIGIETNDNINTVIQTLAARICACCLSSTLTIQKTASDLTPVVESEITFTVIVSNAGSSSATNVLVEDAVPTGFELISYTVTDGTYVDSLFWNIGTMAPYQVSVLTMVVKVKCSGIYENVAFVKSDQSEEIQSSVTVVPEILCTSCCENPIAYFLNYAFDTANAPNNK